MYLKAHKYVRTNISYKYFIPTGTKTTVNFMLQPSVKNDTTDNLLLKDRKEKRYNITANAQNSTFANRTR